MSSIPPFRVAITSAGVVSPLGFGLAETREALFSSRSAVAPTRLFDVSKCRAKTAAQVEDARLSEKKTAQPPQRASLMLAAAARQTLAADPGFRPEQATIGTTSGGMSFGESFCAALAQKSAASKRHWPGWLAAYLPQKPVMEALAVFEACGKQIPTQVIANACASGANAIGHAFELIRAGVRTRVLAGGYDAICELVYIGFDSLQASTPEMCRPFDKERTGLVMGEGAALLALEEWESARRRGAPILGEVVGYGVSTDNHHLTQPHPSGRAPLAAMRGALASGGLAPGQIDYINAHGTATTFNDATEGAAIAELWGAACPPVSSTKALMGHSLGAAGAIEAVFCLLALQGQFLPLNANYQHPDPQWALNIVTETRPAPLRRVLSNSFGFGGTNASLIFGLL